MKTKVLAVLLIALPLHWAGAHHGGERMDIVMAEREPAFEATDLAQTPRLPLTRADGTALDLDSLEDRIVVLSFAPDGCAPCEAQQALLRQVQDGVNLTPMRERVIFVTVGPAVGTGWDDANWLGVSASDDAAAAAGFAALSERGGDAPMAHVVDRGGRHSGIFHGTDFGATQLIVYLNALSNAPAPR